MEEKVGADDVGSEEDDVDAQGKFFVAINVRSRHRKLHICGRCGTKPGQNFAAYEPHNNLKGVKLKFPLWPLLEGQRPKGSRGKLDDDEFERHGLSSKKKGRGNSIWGTGVMTCMCMQRGRDVAKTARPSEVPANPSDAKGARSGRVMY